MDNKKGEIQTKLDKIGKELSSPYIHLPHYPMPDKSFGSDINQVYRLLFETAAESLLIVDKSGVIQLVNHRTNEMFGYEGKELIGKTMEILLPDKYRKSHVANRDSYTKHPKRSRWVWEWTCGESVKMVQSFLLR